MEIARIAGGLACCSGLLVLVIFAWAACAMAGRSDRWQELNQVQIEASEARNTV
jgi:hypothetical protein